MPKLRELFDGCYVPPTCHMSPIEDNYSLLIRLIMALSRPARWARPAVGEERT